MNGADWRRAWPDRVPPQSDPDPDLDPEEVRSGLSPTVRWDRAAAGWSSATFDPSRRPESQITSGAYFHREEGRGRPALAPV